jgi:hypothetical protein
MLSAYRARWAGYCLSWFIGTCGCMAIAIKVPSPNSLEQLLAMFLMTFPVLMSAAATSYFGLGAFCARFVSKDRKMKCFGIPIRR